MGFCLSYQLIDTAESGVQMVLYQYIRSAGVKIRAVQYGRPGSKWSKFWRCFNLINLCNMVTRVVALKFEAEVSQTAQLRTKVSDLNGQPRELSLQYGLLLFAFWFFLFTLVIFWNNVQTSDSMHYYSNKVCEHDFCHLSLSALPLWSHRAMTWWFQFSNVPPPLWWPFARSLPLLLFLQIQ